MLDCAIIYILLIIEHNGDVSPENKSLNFRGLTEKDFETRQNIRSPRCVPNHALPELSQKRNSASQLKRHFANQNVVPLCALNVTCKINKP